MVIFKTIIVSLSLLIFTTFAYILIYIGFVYMYTMVYYYIKTCYA
jgi:hypothetical protein